MRDMTENQFFAALKRRGIVHEFCGYYKVNQSLSVYAGNAGTSRRARLAYLIAEQKKETALEH